MSFVLRFISKFRTTNSITNKSALFCADFLFIFQVYSVFVYFSCYCFFYFFYLVDVLSSLFKLCCRPINFCDALFHFSIFIYMWWCPLLSLILRYLFSFNSFAAGGCVSICLWSISFDAFKRLCFIFPFEFFSLVINRTLLFNLCIVDDVRVVVYLNQFSDSN